MTNRDDEEAEKLAGCVFQRECMLKEQFTETWIFKLFIVVVFTKHLFVIAICFSGMERTTHLSLVSSHGRILPSRESNFSRSRNCEATNR